VEKISHLIDKIARSSLFFLVSLMAIVVFAQVILRFVFKHSLFWSEELSRYLLVWISFIGASIAFKSGYHIGVQFMLNKAPNNFRKILEFSSSFFILFFLIVVTIKGVSLCRFTFFQFSPAMRIRMAYPYAAIPVGSLLMIIHLIADISERIKS